MVTSYVYANKRLFKTYIIIIPNELFTQITLVAIINVCKA